tara:strand:+ start:1373 stop:1777 length:405 start_codon:yes stop_codon:yes gene_type:complete
LLIACSPQKRLNRLINKYPHLTETSIDTIFVIDTVIIDNYDTTVLNNIIKHDSTIVINNEKVYLKYFYDTLRQEIYHEIECFGDTIIKEKIIPYKVEKVVYKELTWWQQYKHLIIIFALLLIALIVLKKLGKLL